MVNMRYISMGLAGVFLFSSRITTNLTIRHSTNLFLALGLAFLLAIESVLVASTSTKYKCFTCIFFGIICKTRNKGEANPHTITIYCRGLTTILWENTWNDYHVPIYVWSLCSPCFRPIDKPKSAKIRKITPASFILKLILINVNLNSDY